MEKALVVVALVGLLLMVIILNVKMGKLENKVDRHIQGEVSTSIVYSTDK